MDSLFTNGHFQTDNQILSNRSNTPNLFLDLLLEIISVYCLQWASSDDSAFFKIKFSVSVTISVRLVE